MSDLVLNVRERWFRDIESGVKTEEYRELKPYWAKRLEGKTYDNVIIRLGYPKKGDSERQIVFPWTGYQIKHVISDEFGGEEKSVFAIYLRNN